jgi:hypothetical protein
VTLGQLASCTFLPQYDAQLMEVNNTGFVGLELSRIYRFSPELNAFLMKFMKSN